MIHKVGLQRSAFGSFQASDWSSGQFWKLPLSGLCRRPSIHSQDNDSVRTGGPTAFFCGLTWLWVQHGRTSQLEHEQAASGALTRWDLAFRRRGRGLAMERGGGGTAWGNSWTFLCFGGRTGQAGLPAILCLIGMRQNFAEMRRHILKRTILKALRDKPTPGPISLDGNSELWQKG